MFEVRVGRNENSKALVFGRFEQFAVLQLRPPAFISGSYFVMRQRMAEWNRDTLVKQNAH